MDEARLVRVTARLQSGVIAPTVFPLPLDGILASAARRARLKGSYGSVVDHHVQPLPLVRTPSSAKMGARWVWAATCALGLDDAPDDLRWYHGRTDEHAAERVVDRLPASWSTGRYKAVRIPQTALVVERITWFALGDPDRIDTLCQDVFAVGKRVRAGEGRVLEWCVEDAGDPDWDRIAWPDGRIGRPFPARAATWLGLTDPDLVLVDAYRPPYWRPPPTTVDGRFARVPVPVIAPWVRRP